MGFGDFLAIQARLLGALPETTRFLYEQMRWENRLTCLYGGRGVGKTTLMLQGLNHIVSHGRKGLYVSADHVQVAALGLYEIASDFFRHGGEFLFIDEAHKRLNWAQEIKSLYDSFPHARIMLSGSSVLALQTGKADLSRRAIYRKLPVMSFREYLAIVVGWEMESFSFEDILDDHEPIAGRILGQGPILGHFRDYLERGAYPFVLEGEAEYVERLNNVVEKTLYEDMGRSEGRRAMGIPVIKKLLWFVATSPPMEFSIDRVARHIKVSRPTVYAYLEVLERAGLIMSVLPLGQGSRLVRKGEKLFLENGNLLWGISQSLTDADPTGALRETFFANQILAAGFRMRVADQGDFVVEERYTFGIGGPGKKGGQIAGVDDSYIVRDGIEHGSGSTIPLWLFGFLY
ncbi:ATP-binding protein [Desulfoplanes sp.]